MRPRPALVDSKTGRLKTCCGNVYVTLGFDEGVPVELTFIVGKSGCCVRAWAGTVGRLITKMLRHGMPLSAIIEDLHKQQCERGGLDGPHVSCLHAAAEWLQREGNRPPA